MKYRTVRYMVNGTYKIEGHKQSLARTFDLGMDDGHEENVRFAKDVATEFVARLNGVDLNNVIWLRFLAVNADDYERDLARLAAWNNGEPIR